MKSPYNDLHNKAMKSKVIFLLCVFYQVCSFILSAQESDIRKLEKFSSFEVVGNIRLEIYPDHDLRAELITHNTTPEKVITDVKDNHLSIRLRTDTPKNSEIIIRLFYNSLEKMIVTAGALVVSDTPLIASDTEFIARSGGKIDLEVEIISLTANVSQGALVTLAGTVQKQDIRVATGGTYSAYKLNASDTNVKAVSAGTAKVTAERIIDATATLRGVIGYKGNPANVYVNTSLGGEVDHFEDDYPD